MLNIRVKITRDGSGDIRVMLLEEYLRGVVPSEIPASSGAAALQAQAVAARTYAAQKIFTRANQPFDVDDTTAYQAYRPNNTDARTDQAIKDTADKVLTYGGKILDTCVYTAANGGRTVSAKERWGTERDYLPAKDDPYDKRAGYAKSGHGVGFSQRGAQQAAKEGLSCQDILYFYYPGTSLVLLNSLITQQPGGNTQPPTANRPTVKLGSKSADVLELALVLAANGYLDMLTFDACIQDAVKKLQKDLGETADGIVGPKTWTAIDRL